MRNTGKGIGRLARTLTVLAAAAAIIMGAAGQAAAGPTDPPDSGPTCEPQTYLYASGNTIVFNGYTNCRLLLAFGLKTAYGRVNGTSHYSHLVTCPSDANQFYCGLNGVYTYLTDDLAGQQQWCLNTLLLRPNAQGKIDQIWSNRSCIWH